MNYVFNEDNSSLIERICNINNVKLEDLDVSGFSVDYDNELLIKFKDGLLDNKDKKFLVVGDYDCDGICATAIIKRLLDDLNIKNNFYIPSRSKESYGLNNKIVETAIQNEFDCLFMVDNGVVASEQLSLCKQANIKTFIIDHHEYEDKPDCDYFLHPNLFNEDYYDMCAGGLCALFSNSIRYDDLTTVYGGLATLADMVTVLKYNRYLLKKMMEILTSKDIYQINFLLGRNTCSYEGLSFNVIPKINAVSRLDEYLNVNHVVEYLLSDHDGCANYYGRIDTINKMRKDYTKTMCEKALSIIKNDSDVIIAYSEDFKEGLCGLVANKLLSDFSKPIIILALVDGELRGSGRSPKGINLYEYLKPLDIFNAFGGHANAVGLTMDLDKLDVLKQYIVNNPLEVSEEYNDVIVLDSDDLSFDTYNQICRLEPYGTGFKQPLLCLRNVEYSQKYVIANKYPKFVLNRQCDAISFNSSFLNAEFTDMIGRLRKDDYHKDKLSFNIEDLLQLALYNLDNNR